MDPFVYASRERTCNDSEGDSMGGKRGIRAFTLVELLVVISVIGLLIAILIPALGGAREQARSVACRSNLKQLMGGMFYYVADYEVLPATHSLFFFQGLFGSVWPRPAGVTWDGAADALEDNLTYHAYYTRPHHLDPKFIADVPGKGTVYPYLKDESVYRCPSDKPGEARDTVIGGGGNGRLSYSLNAYIGYRSPESLARFKYVADAMNNKLPGGQKTRSFQAGQVVNFAAAKFMTMFEEHPNFHMNTDYPEGNFNGIDRIATRHMSATAANHSNPTGRANIAFLDGHAESPVYPAKTMGRELFAEFGQPHYWRDAAPPDNANMSRFIRRLSGPCPW